MLEPTEALESTENALRLVVRQLLGAEWRGKVTPERLAQFEQRMAAESKRRDGVQTSTDLLEFTDFTDLTRIILKEGETFKDVFDDLARLKIYFKFFEDVRNAIAHSRPLVAYERQLLSGMALHLRNQVGLYRQNSSPKAQHYPLIESVRDNFGREGLSSFPDPTIEHYWPALNVGEKVSFECRAVDPRGRQLFWQLSVVPGHSGMNSSYPLLVGEPIEGDAVTLEFTATEENVSLRFVAQVLMWSSGRHHVSDKNFVQYFSPLGGSPGMIDRPYDDSRSFFFVVNPPFDN